MDLHEVDVHRLSSALGRNGIHSLGDFGIMAGHSKNWLPQMLRSNNNHISTHMLASLAMFGISYDDVKPIKKPVAKAPSAKQEEIGILIGDMTPQELFQIMKEAFIEALNAGKEA